MNKLYFGNNLDVLRESIKDETIDLIRVLNDEILPHGAKIISALVPDVIIGRPKGGPVMSLSRFSFGGAVNAGQLQRGKAAARSRC